jgi:hypothetical protein
MEGWAESSRRRPGNNGLIQRQPPGLYLRGHDPPQSSDSLRQLAGGLEETDDLWADLHQAPGSSPSAPG